MAITTSDGLGEFSICIGDGYGNTVVFGLDSVSWFVVDTCFGEYADETSVSVVNVVCIITIFERQKWIFVSRFFESILDDILSCEVLGRAIWRDEFWVLGLDMFEVCEKLVVFIVGNDGVRLLIISAIVFDDTSYKFGVEFADVFLLLYWYSDGFLEGLSDGDEGHRKSVHWVKLSVFVVCIFCIMLF